MKKSGANKLKKYAVVYTDDARKSIRKIDKKQQNLVKKWIEKNINGLFRKEKFLYVKI